MRLARRQQPKRVMEQAHYLQVPAMFLALACLWIGFLLGLVCAALMRGESRDPSSPTDVARVNYRHVVTRHPYRPRPGSANAEERAEERHEDATESQ
jgi:hypothetical protein